MAASFYHGPAAHGGPWALRAHGQPTLPVGTCPLQPCAPARSAQHTLGALEQRVAPVSWAAFPFAGLWETLPMLAWMYKYSCCLLPCFSRKALGTFRGSGNFHYFSQRPPPSVGLQTHTLCCFDVISSKYFATERQCRVTEVLQAWASGFQPSPVNNSSITH